MCCVAVIICRALNCSCLHAYNIASMNTDSVWCAAVDGEWSDWAQWSECSASCGGGIQQRQRTCRHPQFGGAGCHGDETQVRKCGSVPCQGNCVLLITVCYVPVRSIEVKTRSCNELASGRQFWSIDCLCVQFEVVVYTSVNSLSQKCLAVVHQTVEARLKMVYGCLAFRRKDPKWRPI